MVWLVLINKQNQNNDLVQYLLGKDVVVEKDNHHKKILGMKRNKASASLKHLD